ncbi:hypothetical protein ACXIUT_18320, partial [Achromobacter denitrificans]
PRAAPPQKPGFPSSSGYGPSDARGSIFAAMHFPSSGAFLPDGARIVGLPTIRHCALQNL